MGKNTGEGKRIGAVTSRIQYYNPKTKMYVKVNTESSKILPCSNVPYKGVRSGDKNKEIKNGEQKITQG
jgi:hypothetical protein